MDKMLVCGSVVLVCSLAAASGPSAVSHGKYIADEIARCADCHTPMTQNGELDKTRWLKGTKLTFQSLTPVPGWRDTAPDITPAGKLWSYYGEAGFVKFLETAELPDGMKAGPPMPDFHLNPGDARAVVEYLKTLK